MDKSSLPLRVRVSNRKQVSGAVIAPVLRDAVPFAALDGLIAAYLFKGDIERHSKATLTNRAYRLGRLVWLGSKQGWQQLG